jgi:hypothetical protein
MKYALIKSVYDVVTKEILIPAGAIITVYRNEHGLVGHFADTTFAVHYWQVSAIQ